MRRYIGLSGDQEKLFTVKKNVIEVYELLRKKAKDEILQYVYGRSNVLRDLSLEERRMLIDYLITREKVDGLWNRMVRLQREGNKEESERVKAQWLEEREKLAEKYRNAPSRFREIYDDFQLGRSLTAKEILKILQHIDRVEHFLSDVKSDMEANIVQREKYLPPKIRQNFERSIANNKLINPSTREKLSQAHEELMRVFRENLKGDSPYLDRLREAIRVISLTLEGLIEDKGKDDVEPSKLEAIEFLVNDLIDVLSSLNKRWLRGDKKIGEVISEISEAISNISLLEGERFDKFKALTVQRLFDVDHPKIVETSEKLVKSISEWREDRGEDLLEEISDKKDEKDDRSIFLNKFISGSKRKIIIFLSAISILVGDFKFNKKRISEFLFLKSLQLSAKVDSRRISYVTNAFRGDLEKVFPEAMNDLYFDLAQELIDDGYYLAGIEQLRVYLNGGGSPERAEGVIIKVITRIEDELSREPDIDQMDKVVGLYKLKLSLRQTSMMIYYRRVLALYKRIDDIILRYISAIEDKYLPPDIDKIDQIEDPQLLDVAKKIYKLCHIVRVTTPQLDRLFDRLSRSEMNNIRKRYDDNRSLIDKLLDLTEKYGGPRGLGEPVVLSEIKRVNDRLIEEARREINNKEITTEDIAWAIETLESSELLESLKDMKIFGWEFVSLSGEANYKLAKAVAIYEKVRNNPNLNRDLSEKLESSFYSFYNEYLENFPLSKMEPLRKYERGGNLLFESLTTEGIAILNPRGEDSRYIAPGQHCIDGSIRMYVEAMISFSRLTGTKLAARIPGGIVVSSEHPFTNSDWARYFNMISTRNFVKLAVEKEKLFREVGSHKMRGGDFIGISGLDFKIVREVFKIPLQPPLLSNKIGELSILVEKLGGSVPTCSMRATGKQPLIREIVLRPNHRNIINVSSMYKSTEKFVKREK